MAVNRISVAIWVTNNCNMNCRYCYEKKKVKKENLSDDKINTILMFIRNIGIEKDVNSFCITFHGGEPLIQYLWIKKFISSIKKNEYFDNKEVRYELTTNGLLLNDEIIDYLNEHFDDVSVSIDGTKETHDSMRIYKNGRGTYDDVITNVKKFLDKNDGINARMTVNSRSIFNFEKNIEAVVSVGFKHIIPVIDIWDNDWNFENIKHIKYANSFINEYQEKYSYIDIAPIIPSSNKKLICDGGKTSFCISEDGWIYPCSFCVGEDKYRCGHISNGLDIIELEKIDNINRSIIEECRGCNNYHSCVSVRCKIVNELFNGSFDMPIPLLCYMEHIKCG